MLKDVTVVKYSIFKTSIDMYCLVILIFPSCPLNVYNDKKRIRAPKE